MGRKRAADGHPDQYQLKYIELGCASSSAELSRNALVRLATPLDTSKALPSLRRLGRNEQYNNQFVSQVQAMEARAKQVGQLL